VTIWSLSTPAPARPSKPSRFPRPSPEPPPPTVTLRPPPPLSGTGWSSSAYHADSLKPAWDKPFFTIPTNAPYGGGTVWTPVTIDPGTGLLYASTGNPSPDFYGNNRPGANLYTDCVIALDALTGKLVWYQQENVHDLLDYDAAAPPMVLTAEINGRPERIVVEGGKDGKWFAWNARTGTPLPYNPDNQGIPFVPINTAPPTPQGTLESPGTLGGENYAPEAFDSKDALALIPGIIAPNLVCSSTNGTTETTSSCPQSVGEQGGTSIGFPVGSPSGNVTAIDVNSGKIVYQFSTPTPMRGGITTTASGLGFFGGLDRTLTVFDTATGHILASLPTSGPIAAPPIVYSIAGRPYVAIVAGGTITSRPSPVPPMVDIYTISPSQAQQSPVGQQGGGSP
jgi:alcohol dehydrogenase (cytochrome c)